MENLKIAIYLRLFCSPEMMSKHGEQGDLVEGGSHR